jgi:hypothetical protein
MTRSKGLTLWTSETVCECSVIAGSPQGCPPAADYVGWEAGRRTCSKRETGTEELCEIKWIMTLSAWWPSDGSGRSPPQTRPQCFITDCTLGSWTGQQGDMEDNYIAVLKKMEGDWRTILFFLYITTFHITKLSQCCLPSRSLNKNTALYLDSEKIACYPGEYDSMARYSPRPMWVIILQFSWTILQKRQIAFLSVISEVIF